MATEKIYKVLANMAQGLDSAEQAQARANIGAISIDEVPAYANADWDASSGEPGFIEHKPDLSIYQPVLTAGDNIDITDNVISATAAPQVNADWDASSGVAEVLNKPAEKTLVAGQNISITESGSQVTIASTSTFSQAQADWTQTSQAAVDYIKHKPAERGLSGGDNITITDNGTTVTISSSQVNADWDASSGAAQILNKPTIPDPLPSMSGKAGKVLTVNSGATAAEWAAVPDELPTRPSSSYETWSLDYDTHTPATPVLEWKKKDSRLLSLTQATVGLDSSSCIVLTQDMISNHRAYVYLDKSAFPSHLTSPGFPWWQVCLHGLRFYKDTADVTLANATWSIPLQVSTAPIAYPFNEQNTAVITTLRFEWESTGTFTDYQGGLTFNVDFLNSDTSAMFLQLELSGYTSKLAVGDLIYFEGEARPLSNIM